ncbi:MAG: HEAT repeat domain-containing protein [Terriglobales bacterium]
MTPATKLGAARTFVRNYVILLRQAKLFGLEHDGTRKQLALTWRELQNALSDKRQLLLGGCGDRLIIDDTSLKASTPERTFLEFLAAAAIGSLQFAASVTAEEFALLVRTFAAAKPGTLWSEMRKSLNGRMRGIRVQEFRLGPDDNACAPGQVGAGAQIAVATLGDTARALETWLQDPQNLVRLVLAAQIKGTTSANASAASESVGEDDVVGLIRHLATLATKSEGANPQSIDSEQNKLTALLANVGLTDNDPRLLVHIAEQLAIRVALERYEHGETRFNAVQQTLDRMGQELELLRKALNAVDGPSAEEYREMLDRQFWAGIPDRVKRSVLLSGDSWCVPPRNIRSFVEPLQESSEQKVAADVLRIYSRALLHTEAERQQRVAPGIAELADLYARAGEEVATPTMRLVMEAWRQAREPLRAQLWQTLLRLAQEAAARHLYGTVAASLAQADTSESVAISASVRDRLPEFMDDLLRCDVPSGDLLEVLRASPEAVAWETLERFAKCARVAERDRLCTAVEQIGSSVLDQLRRLYREGPDAEGLRTIGALSLLDMPLLTYTLPQRVSNYGRAQQDEVVRQIARAGAAGRGRLLASLLGRLHRLVVPQALDEIGISGDSSAVPVLLVAATNDEAEYLQLKAIEALGRLRDPAAIKPLSDLASAKRWVGWEYPKELRIVALQALTNIAPEVGRKLASSCGLQDSDMRIAPLAPAASGEWLRARRYRRVTPASSLLAQVISPAQRCTVAVESLSLGGGAAVLATRAQLGTEATMQLQLSFHRLSPQVLLRPLMDYRLSFEIADITMEERLHLRHYLASQLPAKADAARSASA